MNIKLILLLLLILSTSCKKKEVTPNFNWSDISIRNSHEEIIIYKELDTASFIKPIYETINHNDFNTKRIGTERKQIKFSNSEKDSIAIYVQQIIRNPIETDLFCTDYVGNLHVTIRNFNSSFSAHYTSVCQVDTLSAETRKLFKILNSKIYFSDN